ncbi:MAG: phosphoribosyltransferase family protein [Bacteroidetes bacterium]|nr:phosphoribosyltransferase family protein [Bacteroidota bacterium]
MSLFQDFFALIYPNNCMACGNNLFKNEHIICTSCLFHLPKTNYHLTTDNPISQAFWGRTNIDAAAAFYYFTKAGKVQHLVHQLKYKGKKEVGVYIGELYGKELIESSEFSKTEVIIPVPLHPKKEKKRGFNQSEVFASGLSVSMNVPLDTKTLIRTFASETQTRKTRFKRWENVKEIFSLQQAEKLENKHILLVDDVITTGATIEACANLLNTIKGVKINVASIAVASH